MWKNAKNIKKIQIKKGFLLFLSYIIIREYDFMSMVSQELINEIRSSVDIVDIVSSYIPLIQKGKNYFGVCPFHDDNNPSMSVSKEKQIFTCFSCGASGNVFKFIMDYENISFMETLKKCADTSGIPLSVNIKSNQDTFLKNKELYDIYDIASKFYQNNINTANGRLAKEYLYNRKIDDSVIKEFGIGLALKNRDLLTKLLLNKKYTQKDLIKSGLVVENNYGLNDIYYDRIMFPIEDLTGKIVGFSGRVYNGETNYKYINTKETDIFKKGEFLYNYSKAKASARQKGYVIVMEGFMDVIRAYTIGIDNVIATMGTAVTKNQAMTIKKMAKEIILCFDGDEAGAKATSACADELVKIGVTPKIVRLEDGMDPDDYIKKFGKDKFLSKIDNPISIMDFKLSYLKNGKDISDSEDLASYVNSAIKELEKIDDEVLREISFKKISLESNLDIDFLKERLTSNKKEEETKTQTKPFIKKDKYEKAQENLIYYMLQSKEVIKLYNKKITYMPNDKYRFLAREISLYYKENQKFNLADFMTAISNQTEIYNTLSYILSLNLNEFYSDVEIDDYINVIREYNVNYQVNRLKDKMKKTSDPLEQAKIAEEIKKLKIDING
ncbi:MAG: DNA primase [Firmicutes bacterium]|nr:DNA primase [Bacillota bacterium]